MIWEGERAEEEKSALCWIDNSQEISATLEHSDISPAERADLEAGYTMRVGLYDEQLSALKGIDY